MADKKNKVRFGLKNVHYGLVEYDLLTKTYTAEPPVPYPGAVNFNAEPSGDQEIFNADDTDYYITDANKGYEIEFENAYQHEDFLTKVMGQKLIDGELFELTDVQPKYIYLIGELNGDVEKDVVTFFYCKPSRSSIGGQTTGDTTTPSTNTIKLKSSPVNGIVKKITHSSSTKYATIYTTAPTLPTIPLGE